MSTSHNAKHVKFVQVAVAGVENNASTQCSYVIVALDEHGQIWEMPAGGPWYQIPSPDKPKVPDDQPF